MSKFILRVIGLFLLIIIILRYDWQKFYLVFKEIRPLSIAMASFLNLFRLFIETLRWDSLLRIQKIKYKLREAFLTVMSSAYVGIVTPGRIGNFIRIFYLENDLGISVGVAMSSVIMDKLIELVTLIFFGWWGLTLLGLGLRTIVAVGLSLFLVALIFLVINYKKLHNTLERIFLKIFRINEFVYKLDEEREAFYTTLRQFKNIKLSIPLILSFLGVITIFIQALFIGKGLNIHLPFIDLAKTLSLTRLVARIIPISFLGLGSKDVAFVAVLNKDFNIEATKGIAFSIIFLFTSYFVTAVAGALCWIIKPIRIEWKR